VVLSESMKILIPTGRLAENIVRKSVGKKADVLVVDIDIAAFINPKRLIKAFQKAKSKNYDLILLPGLVTGDFQKLLKNWDVKYDLDQSKPMILISSCSLFEKIEFSKKIPACEFLIDLRKEKA